MTTGTEAVQVHILPWEVPSIIPALPAASASESMVQGKCPSKGGHHRQAARCGIRRPVMAN